MLVGTGGPRIEQEARLGKWMRMSCICCSQRSSSMNKLWSHGGAVRNRTNSHLNLIAS